MGRITLVAVAVVLARRVLVAALLCAVLAVPSPGATWTSAGPAPADVTALGLDPAHPTTLYAGTAGGAIFRSTDGGATWQRTPSTGDFGIGGIAVNGSQVLASSDSGSNTGVGGVYRSLDGGASWAFAGAAAGIANGIVDRVAIDPANPAIVLAGTNGGLFRSVDGGSTWQQVTVPSGIQIGDVLFDPVNAGVVYVASFNQGVSRSGDHGAIFTAFNAGFISDVGGLALDGTTLWSAGFYGVEQTSTAAASWTDASNGLPMDPGLSNIVVTPGGLLVPYGNGIYSTATSFISWGLAPLPPFSVGRLVADASSATRVYALGAGLARSDNAGLTWNRIDAGITGLGTSRVAATAPGSLLVGTNDGAMLRSDDLGATFASSSSGLTATNVALLAPDPVDPANVYAVVGTSLFASADGGRNWSPRSFGFTLYGPAIAVAPSDPRILYGATFTGAIGVARRSIDSGMTWNPVMNGLSFNFPYAAAVDPTNADIAYLATDSHLYETTNGGMMWGPIDGGLPGGTFVSAIAVDPTAPMTLYVGVGGSVWRSPDRGVSWSPTSALPPGSSVTDLLIDPLRPRTLYVATPNGVLRSTDAGGAWQSTSDGLPNAHAHSLSVDRDHATLYAATDGGLAVERFVAALSVAATLSAPVVVPDGQATLSATVANDGPDDATRLVVTVGTTLGVAVTSATIGGGACTTTPTVSCQLDRLNAGQQAAITIGLHTGMTMGTSALSLAATAAQDVGSGASTTADLRVVDGPFVTTDVIHIVKHKALVPMACATTKKKVCKGRIVLSAAARNPRARVLGKARFAIRRGHTATVKTRLKHVKLNPGEQLPAELSIRAAGANATAVVTLQQD